MQEMIGQSGMGILGQPKQQLLKEIAGHISDKDQTVRSSAMNCLVEVHKFIGDDIYSIKKIGRLGEKEESYLRERIKRAGSSADMPPPPAAAKPDKTRRGTVTIKKGAAPVVKREPETFIKEEPEPEIPTGRFSLEEPAPAKTNIDRINLLPTDADDLLVDFSMPVLKHTEGNY
mgnify:CR=1 FL=1